MVSFSMTLGYADTIFSDFGLNCLCLGLCKERTYLKSMIQEEMFAIQGKHYWEVITYTRWSLAQLSTIFIFFTKTWTIIWHQHLKCSTDQDKYVLLFKIPAGGILSHEAENIFYPYYALIIRCIYRTQYYTVLMNDTIWPNSAPRSLCSKLDLKTQ